MDYTTDAFGREASSFIERNRERPWFLYLAFNAVHTPMQATDARLAKFAGVTDNQRRTYNAMMLALDEAVGAVRRKLAETGLEKKTLIAFISDNGGPTMRGVTVNGSRNEPLRGSKRTTLEGGIRVPFLLALPGRIQPGVYEQPVNQLDLTATAAKAAGATMDHLEGVDLVPFLAGEKSGAPHEALYWRFGAQMAVRAGDYKLVRYDSNADTGTGNGKAPVTSAKLYNLASDIHEDKDLAGAEPEKVRELQALWDAWNQKNVAPLWGGRGADNDGPEPGSAKGKRRKVLE
jgi:arylsulfatase A-like enzyme